MFSLTPWRKEREISKPLVPWTERALSLFRSDLDELFDRILTHWPTVAEDGWMRMAGLEEKETDEAVLIRTDAPGFEPSDFNIEVSGHALAITAEHTVEGTEKKPTIERSLRRYVTLPATVDPEKVEAKYRHGVLELTLAKTEPTKHHKVEVKAE